MHTEKQIGDLLSHVAGQLEPHSLYTMPLEHSVSVVGATVTSLGQFPGLIQLPSCSTIPSGQKHPGFVSKMVLTLRSFSEIFELTFDTLEGAER